MDCLPMSDTLARIIADQRNHIVLRKTQISLAALEAEAKAASPVRGFTSALDRAHAEDPYGLIAEVKKVRQSQGWLTVVFDPLAPAGAIPAGGATSISFPT